MAMSCRSAGWGISPPCTVLILQTQHVDQESFQEPRQTYFICFPLTLLIPVEEESIPDTLNPWNLGAVVLRLCAGKKYKARKLLPVYFSFLQAPQCHPQTVGTSCPTNRWRQEKSKSLAMSPHPTHTAGGLAGKPPSLGQSLRLPEPLKKSH